MIEPTLTRSFPAFRYSYQVWTILLHALSWKHSPNHVKESRFWKPMHLISHLKSRKLKPLGCKGHLGEDEKYYFYSWGYSQNKSKWNFLKCTGKFKSYIAQLHISLVSIYSKIVSNVSQWGKYISHKFIHIIKMFCFCFL